MNLPQDGVMQKPQYCLRSAMLSQVGFLDMARTIREALCGTDVEGERRAGGLDKVAKRSVRSEPNANLHCTPIHSPNPCGLSSCHSILD